MPRKPYYSLEGLSFKVADPYAEDKNIQNEEELTEKTGEGLEFDVPETDSTTIKPETSIPASDSLKSKNVLNDILNPQQKQLLSDMSKGKIEYKPKSEPQDKRSATEKFLNVPVQSIEDKRAELSQFMDNSNKIYDSLQTEKQFLEEEGKAIDLLNTELNEASVDTSNEQAVNDWNNKVKTLIQRADNYKNRVDGFNNTLSGLQEERTALLDRLTRDEVKALTDLGLDPKVAYQNALRRLAGEVPQDNSLVKDGLIEAEMPGIKETITNKKDLLNRTFIDFGRYDLPRWLGSMVEGLGVLQNLDSKVPENLKGLTLGSLMQKGGKELQKFGERPKDRPFVDDPVYKFGHGAATMLASLPATYTGGILGGTTGALALGFSATAALEGGASYEEAVNYFTENGVPREEAVKEALPVLASTAIINGALEVIPQLSFLKRTGLIKAIEKDASQKIIKSGLIKKIDDLLQAKLGKGISQGVLKGGKQIGDQAIEEGLTEAAQEITPLIMESFYKYAKDKPDLLEAVNRIGESGFYGALLGSIMQGFGNAGNYINNEYAVRKGERNTKLSKNEIDDLVINDTSGKLEGGVFDTGKQTRKIHDPEGKIVPIPTKEQFEKGLKGDKTLQTGASKFNQEQIDQPARPEATTFTYKGKAEPQEDQATETVPQLSNNEIERARAENERITKVREEKRLKKLRDKELYEVYKLEKQLKQAHKEGKLFDEKVVIDALNSFETNDAKQRLEGIYEKALSNNQQVKKANKNAETVKGEFTKQEVQAVEQVSSGMRETPSETSEPESQVPVSDGSLPIGEQDVNDGLETIVTEKDGIRITRFDKKKADAKTEKQKPKDVTDTNELVKNFKNPVDIKDQLQNLSKKNNEESRIKTQKLNEAFENNANNADRDVAIEERIMDKIFDKRKLTKEEEEYLNENNFAPEGFYYDNEGNLQKKGSEKESVREKYLYTFNNNKIVDHGKVKVTSDNWILNEKGEKATPLEDMNDYLLSDEKMDKKNAFNEFLGYLEDSEKKSDLLRALKMDEASDKIIRNSLQNALVQKDYAEFIETGKYPYNKEVANYIIEKEDLKLNQEERSALESFVYNAADNYVKTKTDEFIKQKESEGYQQYTDENAEKFIASNPRAKFEVLISNKVNNYDAVTPEKENYKLTIDRDGKPFLLPTRNSKRGYYAPKIHDDKIILFREKENANEQTTKTEHDFAQYLIDKKKAETKNKNGNDFQNYKSRIETQKFDKDQFDGLINFSKPVKNLKDEDTGWKKIDINDASGQKKGVALLNPNTYEIIEFYPKNDKSGSDLIRSNIEANAYAIDNPIEREQIPKGEIVVKDLVKNQNKPEEVTPFDNSIAGSEKIQEMLDKEKSNTKKISEMSDSEIKETVDNYSTSYKGAVTSLREKTKIAAQSLEPKYLRDASKIIELSLDNYDLHDIIRTALAIKQTGGTIKSFYENEIKKLQDDTVKREELIASKKPEVKKNIQEQIIKENSDSIEYIKGNAKKLGVELTEIKKTDKTKKATEILDDKLEDIEEKAVGFEHNNKEGYKIYDNEYQNELNNIRKKYEEKTSKLGTTEKIALEDARDQILDVVNYLKQAIYQQVSEEGMTVPYEEFISAGQFDTTSLNLPEEHYHLVIDIPHDGLIQISPQLGALKEIEKLAKSTLRKNYGKSSPKRTTVPQKDLFKHKDKDYFFEEDLEADYNDAKSNLENAKQSGDKKLIEIFQQEFDAMKEVKRIYTAKRFQENRARAVAEDLTAQEEGDDGVWRVRYAGKMIEGDSEIDLLNNVADYIVKNLDTIQEYNNRFKKKQSDQQPKEQTKPDNEQNLYQTANTERNLIAVHNLTATNLKFADRMGGFAMPSMAIVKKEHGFNKYGEISLIVDKNEVDPAYNHVYNRDMYSPTYPTVYRYVDARQLNKLEDDINTSIPVEIRKEYDYKIARLVEDIRKGYYTNKGLSTEDILKIYYLAKTDQLPELTMVKDKLRVLEDYDGIEEDVKKLYKPTPKRTEEAIQRRADELLSEENFYKDSDESFRKQVARERADDELRTHEQNKHDELLRNLYEKIQENYVRKKYNDDPRIVHYMLERIKEKNVNVSSIQRDVDRILNPKKVLDSYAYSDKVNEVIKEKQKDYDAFINNTLDNVLGDEYIEKGRRKIAHSLDNVIDVMGDNLLASEKTLVHGLGKSAAKNSKRFNNYEELKAEQKRLVDYQEFEKRREELEDEFSKLYDKLYRYVNNNDFGFDNLDNLSKAIGEISATERMQDSSIKRILRKNSWGGVPDYYYSNIKHVASLMKNMPTQYFEAKMYGTYGLNKFVGAVVPNNIDQETLDILKKNNIKVETYEPDNEESRLEALQKFEDALFQKQTHDKTKTSFERLSPVYQDKFLSEVNKGITNDWTVTPANLSKEQAAGVTRLISRSIQFDPTVANMTTAWEESFHASMIALAKPSVARDMLRKAGWDGVGEITDVKNNKSLRDAHEKLADDYIKFRERREAPKNWIERIFVQLEKLWSTIAGKLYNMGFHTNAGYFQLLSTGELKANAEAVQQSILDQQETLLAQEFDRDKNFQNWFKGSKVVDKNGKPLVVYHGTKSDFDTFNIKEAGKTDAGLIGKAFYFTPSGEQASSFSENDMYGWMGAENEIKAPNVMPVYVSIQNPFIIEDGILPHNKQMLTEFYPFGNFKGKSEKLQSMVKKKGYDGAIFKVNGEIVQVVVFYPTQIKSIFNKGTFNPNDANIMYQSFSPIWFSKLERILEEKAPGKISSYSQIKSMLKNNGVKDEEIEWLDIEGFIKEKGSVTKQELIDYVKSNNVKIEEIEKGQDSEAERGLRKAGFEIKNYQGFAGGQQIEFTDGKNNYYGSQLPTKELRDLAQKIEDTANTKFSQYQEPGGSNYKELLLTMPEKVYPINWQVVTKGKDGRVVKTGKVFETEQEAKDFMKYLKDVVAPGTEITIEENKADYAPKANENFKSTHFDEPNILTHIRFNDRTDSQGRKILFLEEVQSDWHQAGRDKGYNTGLSDFEQNLIKDYKNEIEILTKDYAEAKENKDTEKSQKIWYRLEHLNREIFNIKESKRNKVPNAPFKKTWHELALRRMIRYAAENGYDGIAWTTGTMQVARYENEMRQKVDAIHWQKNNNNEVILNGVKSGQNAFTGTVPLTGTIEIKEQKATLDDIVGKAMASQIRESNKKSGTFEGENLTIGGEGMKGFYDQMIPSYLNKYGKKWGAKVEETEIETSRVKRENGLDGNESVVDNDELMSLGTVGVTVPYFPITEEMKYSVLFEGQNLYQGRSKNQEARSETNKITNNPNFKKWFGDSKVVDENGEPLVVYHGTKKSFEIFDSQKTNDTLFWFTSNKEAIERGEVGASGKGAIMPVYLKIENPAGWEQYEKLMMQQIMDAGYDGLILDDYYIAFNPNQIKSVNNQGTFSSEDDNILYQKLDQEKEGYRDYYTETFGKPVEQSPVWKNERVTIPARDRYIDKKFYKEPTVKEILSGKRTSPVEQWITSKEYHQDSTPQEKARALDVETDNIPLTIDEVENSTDGDITVFGADMGINQLADAVSMALSRENMFIAGDKLNTFSKNVKWLFEQGVTPPVIFGKMVKLQYRKTRKEINEIAEKLKTDKDNKKLINRGRSLLAREKLLRNAHKVYDITEKYVIRRFAYDYNRIIEDKTELNRFKDFRNLTQRDKDGLLNALRDYFEKVIPKTGEKFSLAEFVHNYDLNKEQRNVLMIIEKGYRSGLNLIKAGEKEFITDHVKDIFGKRTEEGTNYLTIDEFKKNYKKLYKEISESIEEAGGEVDEETLNMVWNQSIEMRKEIADKLVEKKYAKYDNELYISLSRPLERDSYVILLTKDNVNEIGEKEIEKVFTYFKERADLERYKRNMVLNGWKPVKEGKISDIADSKDFRQQIGALELMRLVEDAGLNLSNETIKELMDSVKARGWSKHTIRRNYTPGLKWTEDEFEKNVSNYIYEASAYKNRFIGMIKGDEALEQWKGDTDPLLLDPNLTYAEKQDVRMMQKWVIKYLNGIRSSDRTHIDKVRSWISVMRLGIAKASYLFQQTLQNFQTAQPVLADEVGVGKSWQIFEKAFRDMAKYGVYYVKEKFDAKDNKTSLPDELIDIIKDLRYMDKVSSIGTKDLFGHSDPYKHYDTDSRKIWRMVGFGARALGSSIEFTTRLHSAIMFYEAGKLKKLKGEELIQYIADRLDETMGEYGKGGRITIFNNPNLSNIYDNAWYTRWGKGIAKSYIIFKTFATHNFGIWRYLIANRSWGGLFSKVTSTLFLGGLKSMPLAASIFYLSSLIANMFKDDDDEKFSLEYELQKLENMVNEKTHIRLGSLINRGVGTYAGTDLSDLLSQSAPIPTESAKYSRVYANDLWERYSLKLIELALGASYGAASDTFKGVEGLGNLMIYHIENSWLDKKEKERAIKNAMRLFPDAIKNAIKAMNFAEDGVEFRNGKLLTSRDLTAWDILLKALSFNPERLSKKYEEAEVKGAKKKKPIKLVF